MKKRILVVDDEPDILSIVEARLIALGYEVLTARDGQEGLNTARKESPDMILLDLMLPKLDGYKVCRMLKFDKTYDHIPIVIFSAKGSVADKKMAEEVGADAYLTKPFNQETFKQTIQKLIGS
ncbi:MAG TPA: response regulator [Candidatus Omnitrophota bacterium]|nr:response regulator [Candidatus Omnitrophota bacterium]HPS37729.1 response regulator [Candidatus Omnitrophota bacterium]